MSSPYPGYPPNFRNVSVLGNYARQCLVVELLSIDKLSNIQLAQILEKLEATMAELRSRIPTIERVDVVTPDRFDPVLRDGLRLPQQ